METALARALGYVVAFLLSGGLLVLLVRMTLFFGKLQGAVESLQRFAEKATTTLEDHGERILVLEQPGRSSGPVDVGRFHPHASRPS